MTRRHWFGLLVAAPLAVAAIKAQPRSGARTAQAIADMVRLNCRGFRTMTERASLSAQRFEAEMRRTGQELSRLGVDIAKGVDRSAQLRGEWRA